MRFSKKIIVGFLLLTMLACTDGFQEINTNPNAPGEVHPRLLLRKVLFDYGEKMSYEGFVAGNLLGQYFTAIDFNLFDRHSLLEPQFGGNPWDMLYLNLRDNELMLQTALDNPALAVYEGPARILKAYIAAALTDIFGDVPYYQGFSGKSGTITPAYDTQESIYLGEEGILDNLARGIAALENYRGVTPLEGDILYGGDLDAWLRFGRSLQIKALMRISGRVDVREQLSALYETGQFIKEPAQNAAFDFSATPPNNFRMTTARVGDYNLYIMSETMEEVLREWDDPRIAILFRPTAADPAVYRGLRNGPDASQISISVADYSLSGAIFRENGADLDANFMTSFETCFLLAEAAERGWIPADARSLYETGVRQAFAYWHTVVPEGYLEEGPAAYGFGGADPLEQILTQKWLANIINGYEGWIEYRRTGLPALKPVTASLNNGLIPVRFPYPTTEATLNSANYQEVEARTNGNSPNVPVWWDVE